LTPLPTSITRLIFILAALLPISPARAADDYAIYSNFELNSYPDLFHKQFLNNMVDPLRKGSRPNSRVAASSVSAPSVGMSWLSTTLASRGSANVAAKLAASYPAASRPEAEKVFREMLSKYGQIELQFGIPKYDLAGSVAAFLAGSYMAYHNTDFPDQNFKPLVNQMRGIIANNPEFARAGSVEKQEIYEQMAMLGMYMAGTQTALKKQPDHPQAARIKINMRQAAKGYLEQFLKTDADRVQITANGLVLK
jgi:hypothetical protein